MKVSVVVTTYNGEKYIIDQLETIRNQSRKADQVLILDDVSTDHTVDKICEFISSNELDSWTVICNETNVGWRRNFMQGAWKASGDYVFFCDQDDLWELDKIETMMGIVESNKDINLLTSKFVEFDVDGTERVLPEMILQDVIHQSYGTNMFKMNYPGCTFCVSRKLIDDSRTVWREKDPHDALLYRMGIMTGGLYTCNKVLVRRRKHGNNTYDVERDRVKMIGDYEEWLEYAHNNIQNLRTYIKEKKVVEYEKKDILLRKTIKWIELRRDFIVKRKFISGIKLMVYLDFYLGKKTYINDWRIFLNPNLRLGSTDTLA